MASLFGANALAQRALGHRPPRTTVNPAVGEEIECALAELRSATTRADAPAAIEALQNLQTRCAERPTQRYLLNEPFGTEIVITDHAFPQLTSRAMLEPVMAAMARFPQELDLLREAIAFVSTVHRWLGDNNAPLLTDGQTLTLVGHMLNVVADCNDAQDASLVLTTLRPLILRPQAGVLTGGSFRITNVMRHLREDYAAKDEFNMALATLGLAALAAIREDDSGLLSFCPEVEVALMAMWRHVDGLEPLFVELLLSTESSHETDVLFSCATVGVRTCCAQAATPQECSARVIAVLRRVLLAPRDVPLSNTAVDMLLTSMLEYSVDDARRYIGAPLSDVCSLMVEFSATATPSVWRGSASKCEAILRQCVQGYPRDSSASDYTEITRTIRMPPVVLAIMDGLAVGVDAWRYFLSAAFDDGRLYLLGPPRPNS